MKKQFLIGNLFIALSLVGCSSGTSQLSKKSTLPKQATAVGSDSMSGKSPSNGPPIDQHVHHDEVLDAIDVAAYRPSEIPDRITLTISGDPATQIAANWRTNSKVIEKTSQAEITLANGSPYLKDTLTISRVITSSSLKTDDYTSHHHSVVFKDLKPNTTYTYRLGNAVSNANSEAETLWSEWAQFTTANSSTNGDVTPFSFIYFGDAQNGIKSHWSRVLREAYSDMPEAAFMLHAGDLVSDYNGNDQEWGEWFYAGGWVNSSTPQIATPGKHEYTRDGVLTNWWTPHFIFPENGPDDDNLKLSETAYHFDYQGVRFISIDSPAMSSSETENIATAQAEWLVDVLSYNPNAWTIVYHHHPVWPAGKKRRQHSWLEKKFKDIYEKFGVDLVLQGHDHTYARGDNISSGLPHFKKDTGPIYVVSVAGSKMYRSDASWADVADEDLQLYQIIDISNEQIRYRALTADGLAYDEFIIKADAEN